MKAEKLAMKPTWVQMEKKKVRVSKNHSEGRGFGWIWGEGRDKNAR